MIDYDQIHPSLHELVWEMNALEEIETIASGLLDDDCFFIEFVCGQNEIGWLDLGQIGTLDYEGSPVSICVRTDVDDTDDFPIIFTLYGNSNVAVPDRVAMWLRGQEEKRSCPACGEESITVGLAEHDACIANLPGVNYACCGHMTESPYLSEEDGDWRSGQEALDRLRELGGNPPREITPEQRRARNLFRLGLSTPEQDAEGVAGEPLDEAWELETEQFLDQVDSDEITFAEQLPTARRITWEYINGHQVPKGYWLRHECDTRECVNPGHAVLELVDA
jgi:Zn ribbon nucleic-acid-binding protein